VSLIEEDTGKKKVWQIVGEPEAVALEGSISVTSPIQSPREQRRLSGDLRATARREPDAAGSDGRVQSIIRVQLRVIESASDHVARTRRRLVVTLRAAWAPWRQHVRRLDCRSQFQGGSEHGDASAAIDLFCPSGCSFVRGRSPNRPRRFADQATVHPRFLPPILGLHLDKRATLVKDVSVLSSSWGAMNMKYRGLVAIIA
jgi:hypothetical protein